MRLCFLHSSCLCPHQTFLVSSTSEDMMHGKREVSGRKLVTVVRWVLTHLPMEMPKEMKCSVQCQGIFSCYRVTILPTDIYGLQTCHFHRRVIWKPRRVRWIIQCHQPVFRLQIPSLLKLICYIISFIAPLQPAL